LIRGIPKAATSPPISEKPAAIRNASWKPLVSATWALSATRR